MKLIFFATLCFTLLVPRAAEAQIYADVSVSQADTPLGSFRILLHHDKAPRAVANFIGLATGEKAWVDPATGAVRIGKPYYNGIVFHRLVHNFVIQGGDPLGTGSGGPGYVFQDEFDPSLRHSDRYVVSMANSGVNSNGSQFFITLANASFLDDLHTVFGMVINDDEFPGSRALIDGFTSTVDFPTDSNSRPLSPLKIESVTISGPDLATFDINDSSLALPTVTGLPIRVRRENSGFFIDWNRERKWDYPFYYSTDLNNWFRITNILSMDDELDAAANVSQLFTGPRGFATMAAVNYTHAPDLPVQIFAAGHTFVLDLPYGDLTLVFDGPGGGSWSFVDSVDPQANASGLFTSGQPENTSLFGIPSSGFFISPATFTYARSLSAREILIFLDGNFGPHGISAIQPELSFHTNTTGWFNGLVNSIQSPGPIFRGTFSWSSGE